MGRFIWLVVICHGYPLSVLCSFEGPCIWTNWVYLRQNSSLLLVVCCRTTCYNRTWLGYSIWAVCVSNRRRCKLNGKDLTKVHLLATSIPPLAVFKGTTSYWHLLSFSRWDDDVVFKNCARGEIDKSKQHFVNDTLRSEFHRKFMEKYVKWALNRWISDNKHSCCVRKPVACDWPLLADKNHWKLIREQRYRTLSRQKPYFNLHICMCLEWKSRTTILPGMGRRPACIAVGIANKLPVSVNEDWVGCVSWTCMSTFSTFSQK